MALTRALHMHSKMKQLYSCRALLCLGVLSVSNRVLWCMGTQLLQFAVRSFHPSWKKRHGWHVFDTVHLFCLGTMHFKEGQDAAIAKCVPNKWYPSQNGSSLESVLAEGSKSMGLCQHPSSLRAGTHSRGTNGLSWLGSSKGFWPRASKLLRDLAAPLGRLSEGRWKPSRGRITMRPMGETQTVKRREVSKLYQMHKTSGRWGHAFCWYIYQKYTTSKRSFRHSKDEKLRKNILSFEE